MDPEPLVTRAELEGIFFVITDLGFYVRRIVDLIEQELGEDDGEDPA
jgi:hypothetical protein